MEYDKVSDIMKLLQDEYIKLIKQGDISKAGGVRHEIFLWLDKFYTSEEEGDLK